MKTLIVAAMAVASLAACGIDGAPVRPVAAPAATVTPGITVTGDVSTGIRADDL